MYVAGVRFTTSSRCRKTVKTFQPVSELGLFVYTSLHLSKDHDMAIEWDSPVPYCSYLIYNPERRWEVWRYLTYM